MRIAGVSVVLAVLLSPVAARATDAVPPKASEDIEDPALAEVSLEKMLSIRVTTATRSSVNASDAPARMVVITKDDIIRRSYHVLRDVFRDLPGYQTNYLANAEVGTSLVVRGLPGNHRLLLLIDGRRFNPPGGEDQAYYENFPLILFDRIEVMYGPGSALYGSDAFNGIINLISSNATRPELSVRAEGGSNISGNVSIYGATEWRGLSVRVGGHATHRDYPDMYALYPNEYRYPALAGGNIGQLTSPDVDLGRYDSGEYGYDLFIGAGIGSFKATYYLRGYELSSAWDQSNIGAPFVPEARFADRQQAVFLTHELKLGRILFNTYLDYSRYDILPQSRLVRPLELAVGNFDMQDHESGFSQAFRFEEKADASFFENTLLLTMGVAGQAVEIMPISSLSSPGDSSQGAAQAKNVDYALYQGQWVDAPATGTDNFVVSGVPTTRFATTGSAPGASVSSFRSLGTYGQAIWQPRRTFQVTAALRMDDSSRFGATLNPRLAIVSVLSPSLTLKLLYGRAYLEPTPYQMDAVGTSMNALLLPNRDLKPENLNSLELIATQSIGTRGLITASGFFNRLDNVIQDTAWTKQYVYVQFPDGRYQQRKVLQSFNAGTGSIYGGEAVLNMRFGMLRSDLAASYVGGTIRRPDLRGNLLPTRLEGVSPLTAQASFTLQPTADLSLNVRGLFQTAPSFSFATSQYPYAGNGHEFFVLCASARYNLDRWTERIGIARLAVFARGENLTDARYKMLSGRPGENPTGAVQPPIMVMGGISGGL